MHNKPFLFFAILAGAFILLISLFSFDSPTLPGSILSPLHSEYTIDYWDEGLAEVSRYTLEQNRYQDVHPGEVVMIFVKEDFLTAKQVKSESSSLKRSTPILKNIMLKKFTTGLYDYTMSTNVFSAFDQNKFPGVFKIQSLSTEWCGSTYTQLNHRDNAYEVELRSYFENEGDQHTQIKDVLTEDEIFNLIRLNPDGLPIGELELIPATQYSRLSHLPIGSYKATTQLSSYEGKEFDEKSIHVYQLDLKKMNRSVRIYFERSYPHRILGWDESFPSMFDRQPRTTKARLSHQIRKDYWKYNRLDNQGLRAELGLK